MPNDRSREQTGPIDADVLRRIAGRIETSIRFSEVAYRPDSAPNAVVADYDTGYFPAAVDRASLRIR